MRCPKLQKKLNTFSPMIQKILNRCCDLRVIWEQDLDFWHRRLFFADLYYRFIIISKKLFFNTFRKVLKICDRRELSMDLKWESNFISNFFNISCKYQQELRVSFFLFERIILRRWFVMSGRSKRSGPVGSILEYFNHLIISLCTFKFSKICMILIKRPFKIISKM